MRSLASVHGVLRSVFRDCELWIRGIVVNIPMTPSKQWVNPLAAGSGAVNPGADFSPAQARKQWLAGWKVAKSVLDSLFANLSLTPDRCASVYVMYGYDCSVPEALLRMSSVLSAQAVTVCWADLEPEC